MTKLKLLVTNHRTKIFHCKSLQDHLNKIGCSNCLILIYSKWSHRRTETKRLDHSAQRLLVLDVSFIELASIGGAWKALAGLPKCLGWSEGRSSSHPDSSRQKVVDLCLSHPRPFESPTNKKETDIKNCLFAVRFCAPPCFCTKAGSGRASQGSDGWWRRAAVWVASKAGRRWPRWKPWCLGTSTELRVVLLWGSHNWPFQESNGTGSEVFGNVWILGWFSAFHYQKCSVGSLVWSQIHLETKRCYMDEPYTLQKRYVLIIFEVPRLVEWSKKEWVEWFGALIKHMFFQQVWWW